ncbi:MAG TPA: ribonuclease H-like domain-containing protein [Candidatus Dojkabacteria bacterium]|nr:ribonuclease H-like domain-containing protein [Candidatus Dojkabacteria bacterium]
MEIIFLDVETQNTFTYGEEFKVDHLKISYLGLIDSAEKEHDFWESDMQKLDDLLAKADLIVGYNIFRFDMPVIANYLGPDVMKYPMLDLMIAARYRIGFNPKLNNLVTATLGRGKLGSGLDAVKYYANGQLEELKKYCLEDVRLTKDLYYHGKNNQMIKYYDKNGFIQSTDIDWSKGYINYSDTSVADDGSIHQSTFF